MDLKLLEKPSIPSNDAEIVDKKRITLKQARYIAQMCEEILEFLREHPVAFSEVRASRIIEALKPSYQSVLAMKRQQEVLYQALMDELDEEEGLNYTDLRDEF